MPAFSHELAEERPPVTADVPFRGSRHHMGFRCPYDFDQHLLASSPPGYGYELWRKTGKSDLHASWHHSYDSSCQTFDRLSKDNSSNGKKAKQRCASIQHTDNSFADIVDATSSHFSESVSLDSIKAETVDSSHHHHHHHHGRVKKVSFADDFGHRLAEVKYFFDRTPTPSRAAHVEAAVLLPDFPMPISVHEVFSEKVDRLRVSLESLSVSTARTLRGIVRVKNLAFEKRVFVRYSFDAWKTSADITCHYRPAFYPGEIDNSHDRFSFALTVPPDFASGSAEFVLCFQCDGREYWDNNYGANYRLVSPNWRAPDVDDDKGIS